MFNNRKDAALQLAKKLEKYKNKNGVILAIPRGGVPIGYEIAKELGIPLEIVLSKKIGHPHNPEFAIGSVSLNGIIINENLMDVPKDYIESEAKRILKTLKEKYTLFMGDRSPVDLAGKTVIIVDDGVATGNTILSTVDTVKKNNPKEIILAVPVGPMSAIKRLSKFVDDLVCLQIPEYFLSVGQFYKDFTQVSDEEVIQLLRAANKIKDPAP